MEAIHRQPQKKMEAAYESAENIYTYSGGSTDGAFGQYYFRKRNFYLKHWPHVCPSPWPSYIH